MNVSLKFFLLFILLLQLVLIFCTIKNKKLSMRYVVFWLLALVLMLIAVIIPDIFNKIATFFGFEVTSNMIFLIGFFFLFYLIFILTINLSIHQNVINVLTQEISILKKDIQNKSIDGEEGKQL